MDEVFRFLFLRPPAPGVPLVVQPSDAFAKDLKEAESARDRKEALKRAASKMVESDRGLARLEDLELGEKLLQALRSIGSEEDPSPERVEKIVREIFGTKPTQLVTAAEFAKDSARLGDNLLAAKLLSRDTSVEARLMESILRLMDVIERIAGSDGALVDGGAVRSALERPTMVGEALAAPVRTPPEKQPEPEQPPPDRTVDRMRDRLRRLEEASQALTRVRPSSFAVPETPDRQEPGAADAPLEILRANLVARIRQGDIERIPRGVASAVAGELEAVQSSAPEVGKVLPSTTRLVLNNQAAGALSPQNRAVLKSLRLDVTKTPLPSALQALNEEQVSLHAQVRQLELKKYEYAVLGSKIYEIGRIFGPGELWLTPPPSVPQTHGSVKPVGVGDLLIVRQQLKRYEGGEVGHIENVLQGEGKKRLHSRTRTTEETITVEEEITSEEERDTQTTERFELQREVSDVIKQDSSFKAGLAVSGSYGPTVEFKASTDFAMNGSKEEASKIATNFSKEVTSRASSKVTQRRRTERIMRTLEVFEERNEHEVDNTDGTGHVVGVYQWVDKVYEAQVFNYGKRMMFDIMVPEPAAFWIYANAHKPQPETTLTKPDPFKLTPKEIADYNYTYYVEKYEVAGVKPPPEPYKTVSKTFEGFATHDDHSSTKVAELPIPDGYEAVTGHGMATGSIWDDWKTTWSMTVSFGKQVWRREDGDFYNHYFTLDNEQGSIPLGIRSFGHQFWFATFEVDCQRTDRAYEAWQLETHAAIQQGYLKLDRDFREELAAMEVQTANEIRGRNPIENRLIERTELKKQAVSVLTAQHYDLFGAISFSVQGFPQPLLSEAEQEGRYIRFFEQALEWEHVMYLFYPYFWGRKGKWATSALLQDVDPQFAEFLRAGSARLVVPVRPGFEAALAHFMDTGEIWEGADPPTLTSPLYVSIIDEIKERTQAPGTEIAQGDPWDVRLPTTLVRLRPDDSLPAWTKQPDGSWLPS